MAKHRCNAQAKTKPNTDLRICHVTSAFTLSYFGTFPGCPQRHAGSSRAAELNPQGLTEANVRWHSCYVGPPT